MKKLFSLLALVLVSLFALVGCSQTESASDIKSNLTKNGYEVKEFTPAEYDVISNMKFSELAGIKSIVQGTKKDGDKDLAILLIVFDNTNNANKVNDTDEIFRALQAFGDRYREDGQTSVYGVHNNVVFAGSKSARIAAGLKLAGD